MTSSFSAINSSSEIALLEELSKCLQLHAVGTGFPVGQTPGAFRFTQLGPGRHDLQVSSPGYDIVRQSREVGRREREIEVEFPAEEGAPWFEVLCRWRVHGKVGHWGHTHRRINEHEARYTVSQDGGEWKIAAVEVLEQKRVDDGNSGN